MQVSVWAASGAAPKLNATVIVQYDLLALGEMTQTTVGGAQIRFDVGLPLGVVGDSRNSLGASEYALAGEGGFLVVEIPLQVRREGVSACSLRATVMVDGVAVRLNTHRFYVRASAGTVGLSDHHAFIDELARGRKPIESRPFENLEPGDEPDEARLGPDAIEPRCDETQLCF